MTELHERLFQDAWQPDLRRHRSNYAFRGRADAAEDLRTSLIDSAAMRATTDPAPETTPAVEPAPAGRRLDRAGKQ